MFKKLSILILALGINLQTYGSEVDLSLRFAFQPPVISLSLAHNPYLQDINFLRGFTNLTSLNLSICINLKDNYQPISCLTKLKILDISGTNLTTTVYIEPLVNLTSLDISLINNQEESFQSLARLPMLKILKLGCDPDNLGGLSRLTSLTTLELPQAFNNHENKPGYIAPSIDYLSCLTNLTKLDLSGSHCLYRIQPIIKLPNLRYLILSEDYNILDLKKISKMKSLKRLKIDSIVPSYMPAIQDVVRSLKKIKTLESLTVHPSIDTSELPKKIRIHKRR